MWLPSSGDFSGRDGSATPAPWTPWPPAFCRFFVGRATRAVEFAAEREKEYLAGLRLGVVTDTQDTTGTVLETHPVCADRPQVEAVLAGSGGDHPDSPDVLRHQAGGEEALRAGPAGPGGGRQPRPITIEALDLLDQVSPTEYTPAGTVFQRDLRAYPLPRHRTGPGLRRRSVLPASNPVGRVFLDQAVTMDQVSAHPAPNSFCCRWTAFSRYPALTLRHGTAEKKTSKRESFDAGGAGRCLPGLQPRGDFLALSRLEQGVLTTIKSFFEV